MIVSFYDKNFRGLQNNASLVIDRESYKLIKRPAELNDLSCVCEAFTEDIQPAFLVIKNDVGNYVYGSLSGIPVLNSENKTEITGTDLKSLLSSEIVITPNTYTAANLVKDYFTALFDAWKTQVLQESFDVEFSYADDVDTTVYFGKNVGTETLSLIPSTETKILNVWEELQSYLYFYELYIDSKIDLVNKKIIFTVGKTMTEKVNIKLWEFGIRNYGKWITTINETQGYYGDAYTAGTRFILLQNNSITSDTSKRDIYPIKRQVAHAETREEADKEALTKLIESMYNENIDINESGKEYTFNTGFNVYVKKGGELYKTLPVGELEYDGTGLIRYQIGYRYSGVEYI